MAAHPPTPKSKNLHWHHGKLNREQREECLRQKGAVVWFTGLSASGKSTVAHEVELALIKNGKNAFVLDGDNIRHGLNFNLGFSPDDRKENIRRIGEVAKLFYDASIITLIAFISPYREDRDAVRRLVPPGRFLEVFCDAPLEVCERRDPKKLYQQARSGQVTDFTGISAPYQPPLSPELVLKTGTETLEESTRHVLNLLEENRLI